MPGGVIGLDEFAQLVDPSRVVLFLGAGSSVTSGAPTGADLSRQLALAVLGERVSDDLTETANILELRRGRPALVAETRRILGGLKPAGGLLLLPRFPWQAIYTTNFDQLIEAAYQEAGQPLKVVRSNYDWSAVEEGVTTLFKIHGCLSQDDVDGHRARIVLTERDYDDAQTYRDVLFDHLKLSMDTQDVLFVGHSLRDRRLQDETRRVAQLHATRGMPGRLFLMSFEQSADWATLQSQKGFTVAIGSLDQLLDAVNTGVTRESSVTVQTEDQVVTLPDHLVPTTTNVLHAAGLEGNALRLFNGSPATYADIASGFTFRRSMEASLVDELIGSRRYLPLVGVAGVGKTTIARRVLMALQTKGYVAFEHRGDFQFRAAAWLEAARRLKRAKIRGVLLVDDCPAFLNQINTLVSELSKESDPWLRLVLTASRAQWLPRNKAPELFESGVVEVRELTPADVSEMISLTERTPEIGRLVQRSFARLSRNEKTRRLRQRCRADMYVCLKNVFDSRQLDNILLREYAELPESQQELYRSVAALEASGTRVHRQLVIRLLGIDPQTISGLLNLMEGLISEYDIYPRDGLYGWATRHPLIAERIAYYKYADQGELVQLLKRLTDNLNPSIELELRTLRQLCNYDYGIRRVDDRQEQVKLYRRLIEVAPGERIPRHRLIGTYLHLDLLDEANHEVRLAEEEVGMDPPLSRYKARLALRRAESAEGVQRGDRVVMYAEARALALQHLQRFPNDKYGYITYADVGFALASKYESMRILDDAIARMRKAVHRILDPQLSERLDDFISARSRFPDRDSPGTRGTKVAK